MKKVIQNERFGEIVYEESFWTGKKSVAVNGTPLEKLSKNQFRYGEGEAQTVATVQGNTLTGAKLRLYDAVIPLTPTIKWYEIVFPVIIFVFMLVWGNVVELCLLVPVVGGVIGGVISALLACVDLFLIRMVRPVWLKALISLGMLAVTFCICWGIGAAILSAV